MQCIQIRHLRFAKKLGYSGYSEFKYDFSIVGHSSVPEEVHESKFDYILDSYTEAVKSIRQYLEEKGLHCLGPGSDRRQEDSFVRLQPFRLHGDAV